MILILYLTINFGLTSCFWATQTKKNGSYSTASTHTPFQPRLATEYQIASSPQVSTLDPKSTLTLWVDPNLPQELRQAIDVPPDLVLTDEREQAILRLEVSDERPLNRWVYVLVAPFPSIPDGVAYHELQNAWIGESGDTFTEEPLLMDEHTRVVFTDLWGNSAAEAVRVLPAGELLDYAWEKRPSWAIVPFESLEPRWKVLEVDGVSPIQSNFDASSYPLTIPVSLNGDPVLADAIASIYGETSTTPLIPQSNREPRLMTTLAMTGVTAMVRATAYAMEQNGITYPAGDISSWLREADLTHISNEVPFAENCPYPNPVQWDMFFCSDPRYIQLLEEVGTDIVELTGDHFGDWGADAMLLTIDLYRERGWYYYGGGADLEEGRQAITIEHNGNRLAFIGCNRKGRGFAGASQSQPGAAACDFPWIHAEVARLRNEGYLPIATFQHFEYYTYAALPLQQEDFRSMAEAGAVIVSGSQAHHPQAIEFYDDAVIHYGLGNLFFDQYDLGLGPRQAFIDRHIFYNGRYISTELLTILFTDYARPRPMTSEEREQLLRSIFAASGW